MKITMKCMMPSIAAGLVLALVTPAGAVAPIKVWVSNTGVDGASCGAVTAPCRTFQQAHNNVAAGGEVGVLTPGDYGAGGFPTFISKSIALTNDGVGEAGIQTGQGTAVALQTNPGDIVSLRGLTIDGSVTANVGIENFQPIAAVYIQNCVIKNFESPGFGILNHSTIAQLLVSDTLIYNNGSGAGTGGIVLRGNANATLDRVHLENNVVGLFVDATTESATGGIHVVVRDSVTSANAADGIFAKSQAGLPPAFLLVERTTSVNNAGSGIHADGPGATVLLSDSTMTRNGAGVTTANSGQLISYHNNRNNNNVGPEGTATGSLSLF